MSFAKWIWISRDTLSAIDTFVLFRKQVKCEARRPVLRLSAVTNFELKVNGEVLPGSQFSDLTDCPTYTDFDLRKVWKDGKNLIEVTVLSVGRECFTSTIHQPGLWAELRDGKSVLATTDASWEAALSPAYRSGRGIHTTGQLGDAFAFDARKTRPEWQHSVEVEAPSPTARPLPPLAESPARPVRVVQAGTLFRHCDDPNVTAARLVTSDYLLPDILDSRYIAPNAKDTQRFLWEFPLGLTLAPENANRLPLQFLPLDTPEYSLTGETPAGNASDASPANGWYLIVDLGEETTGWLTFTLQAAEGTVLDIAHGEHLDDGRVRAFLGGRNFADRYICHAGVNTFTHRLRRLGARYLEMHITEATEPPRVGYLGMLPVYRNLPTPNNFRTEDSALVQLDKVAIHTLRCCQHEHYEDCPWREQSLYAYDSRNQALYGYYVWGNYDFAYTAFALLAGNPDYERKLLKMISPGTCIRNIPIFTLAWIDEVWELYLHSGNPQCDAFVPIINDLLENILTQTIQTPAGTLYAPDKHENTWNFCEWVPGLADSRVRTTAKYHAAYNLYLVEALRNAAKLNDAFHFDAPCDFAKCADQLAKTIDKFFWDAQKGCYRTDEQCEYTHEHIQALALFNHVVPKSKIARVLKAMKAPGTLLSTYSTLPYWVHAMQNLSPECRAEIMPRLRATFLPAVFNGATTLWETAEAGNDFAYAGSLCHGWSSLPSYYFRAGVLGVTPAAPGFTKFRVNPDPAGLTHAEGEVPTPYGPIHVEWRLDKNGQPKITALTAPKECKLA